jgi:UDPglucose 6-dehydrogenase
MGMDGRIGNKFLHPGPGFGGSCFPKDAKALVALGRSVSYDVRIVQATLAVNEFQKESIIDRVRRLVPDLTEKTVALLGLAFKPETDDMREAPSIRIVADLVEGRARVRAYDPAAMESARQFLSGVEYCEDEYHAARGSDALVVVTEWNQFRSLDLSRLKSCMREPNIIDLRNIYEPEMVRSAGFRYVGMGRT